MATGDIRIDTLLELAQTSLAQRHTPGVAVEVTYSFLSTASVSYQVYDFQPFSQSQQAAVRAMLDEVSTQIGVSFREVDQGGTLQYGMYSGRAGIPSSIVSKAESITNSNGSVVWLNSGVSELQNLSTGSGRQMVLHETGHALGLKHPGQYSQFDSGPYLPTDLATAAHTIMAYNGGNTEHFGDYDLLALQYLYGSASQPIGLNAINVTSASATGSYFNDRFILDTATTISSVSVSGGTGVDQLDINVSSSRATLSAELKSFTYTKANGSFAGVYLDSVERIHFTDQTLAFDVEGNAGQAYRLYKAAFDRTPDKEGLGFWISVLDKGASLESVAAGFVASQEFQTINGTHPTNLQLVSSLYQHVLGRAPDQAGLDFWTAQLDNNSLPENNLLVSFSESNENKIALSGQISAGIEYVG